MRHFLLRTLVFGTFCLGFWNIAQAQYRPPPSPKEEVSAREEPTGDALNLKHFRKGTYDWDTQEMIISGFNTLHRENARISKEIGELKAEIAKLKEKK